MTALVGNVAGWHLQFFSQRGELAMTDRDYYAAIEAALPGGLDGGHYEFAIEGITNAHYQWLHGVWQAQQPLYLDLYLYWRDVDAVSAVLTSAGLLGPSNPGGVTDAAGKPADAARVARLAVTRLSRRIGPRRYEAVIEACERVHLALRKRPTETPGPAKDPRRAAVVVAAGLLAALDPARTSVIDTQRPSPQIGASWPPSHPRAWKTGLEALSELERSMIALAGQTGRGMYLIRDGVLHIGVRDIPLAGDVVELSDANGLVHVETSGVSQSEQRFDPAIGHGRVQYTLTLKGRPDLRPGDKVAFRDPLRGNADDAAVSSIAASPIPLDFAPAFAKLGESPANLLADSTVELYVSGVQHRLSRTEGFVTVVTGVALPRGPIWDPVSQAGGDVDADPGATPHIDTVNALRRVASATSGEPLAVGEVRAATLAGAAEPPSQTIDVWVGTVLDDGGPARVRRLAVDREARSRASGVAYTTPFAWGKCGLVLPRYPGTRVVLGHVGGRVDDPVDLGAVWESGHGPESQPGDWWLILPAAVARANRQIAEDSDTPQEPAGKASNDLIDADGARVIEVGRLTVRVQPSRLAAAGTRPAAPADAAEQVTIEHENGSRIVIKDSGDIVIHSEANVTLSAKHALTLEADDVVVKVKNTMDVKGRD